MSSSSKKIIRRIVRTASSAVRTSETSWYIWSGISQSFWKTRPRGTFLTPCEPPSDECHEKVCSHSPGRGMNKVGPYSTRRWTAAVPSLLL